MLACIFEWSAPCPQAKHHHSRSLISYPPRLVIVGILYEIIATACNYISWRLHKESYSEYMVYLWYMISNAQL